MTPSLYTQMIVHWRRNENGTVQYDWRSAKRCQGSLGLRIYGKSG